MENDEGKCTSINTIIANYIGILEKIKERNQATFKVLNKAIEFIMELENRLYRRLNIKAAKEEPKVLTEAHDRLKHNKVRACLTTVIQNELESTDNILLIPLAEIFDGFDERNQLGTIVSIVDDDERTDRQERRYNPDNNPITSRYTYILSRIKKKFVQLRRAARSVIDNMYQVKHYGIDGIVIRSYQSYQKSIKPHTPLAPDDILATNEYGPATVLVQLWNFYDMKGNNAVKEWLSKRFPQLPATVQSTVVLYTKELVMHTSQALRQKAVPDQVNKTLLCVYIYLKHTKDLRAVPRQDVHEPAARVLPVVHTEELPTHIRVQPCCDTANAMNIMRIFEHMIWSTVNDRELDRNTRRLEKLFHYHATIMRQRFYEYSEYTINNIPSIVQRDTLTQDNADIWSCDEHAPPTCERAHPRTGIWTLIS
ncbi:hypothetical protein GUITHDRAFT_149211 [Guillardia theta CCMP2712]|uniref:Uncharacterized protein n=1 Tax=Guillardia theta (strain CCMP2712) TaxID=905079 RepID=L1I654_GUITC|nr:hypothetical protein GUITHDRAFT_149211 [Guillardia theta CCMP2712]EKX31577.1 hypothetical protein GUITHDRAFT_149211 [Guillardia theta CCMP2712]|eukprot:XP_005818557.1 hypothetical protein GUITHDRAFT_149211 [Guillardia theta CCMP2712]